MTYDYVIIGGGCYGSYYVDQLFEGRTRGKVSWSRIAVLDTDADCQVARASIDGVDVVVTDWTEFGPVALGNPDRWLGGHVVPAPIAPHVMRHWLCGALEARGRARATHVPYDGALPELPFADVTDQGTIVLSWAPGLCPTNCVEPRSCPLIQAPRTWDMPDTVTELAEAAGMPLFTFVCRHHAYGVGTIVGADILTAWRRLLELPLPETVAFATTSGCHGLADVVRLDVEDERPGRC